MGTVAHCIGCGCHDYAACEDLDTCGPCHWLAVDYEEGRGVCSACPEDLERWDAGDRTLAVPVDDDHEVYIDDDEAWGYYECGRHWNAAWGRLKVRREAARLARRRRVFSVRRRRPQPHRHHTKDLDHTAHHTGYALPPASIAPHRLEAWGYGWDEIPF